MSGYTERDNAMSAATTKLLKGLAIDLQNEFSAVIMYRLYASMVQGPYRQELRAFFAKEIPEELRHAQILADKISALGGTPPAMPAPVKVVSDVEGDARGGPGSRGRYHRPLREATQGSRKLQENTALPRTSTPSCRRDQPPRRASADARAVACHGLVLQHDPADPDLGPLVVELGRPGRHPSYTRTVFHRPRLNSHRVNRPTAVSETKIAQKIPAYPMLVRLART